MRLSYQERGCIELLREEGELLSSKLYELLRNKGLKNKEIGELINGLKEKNVIEEYKNIIPTSIFMMPGLMAPPIALYRAYRLKNE